MKYAKHVRSIKIRVYGYWTFVLNADDFSFYPVHALMYAGT